MEITNSSDSDIPYNIQLLSFENLEKNEKDKLMTDIIKEMPGLLKLYEFDKENLDLLGKIFIWRMDRFGAELFIGDGTDDRTSLPDCIKTAEKWFNNLFNFLELVEKIPNPPTNSWRLINQFCYWHFEETQGKKGKLGENLQVRLLKKIEQEGNEIEHLMANRALKWHYLLTERVAELLEKKDEKLLINWYQDLKELLEFGQFISHPRLQTTLNEILPIFPGQAHLMMDFLYEELHQFADLEKTKIFYIVNSFFDSFSKHPHLISENSNNVFFNFSVMRLFNLSYSISNKLDLNTEIKFKSFTSEILIKLGSNILFYLLNFEKKYDNSLYIQTLSALNLFFYIRDTAKEERNNFVIHQTQKLLENYKKIESIQSKKINSNSLNFKNNPNFIDSIKLKICNGYNFPIIYNCAMLLYYLDPKTIGYQQYVNIGQKILLRYKDPNLLNPSFIYLAFHFIKIGISNHNSIEELNKVNGNQLDLLRLRFNQRFIDQQSNPNKFESFNVVINKRISLLNNGLTTKKKKNILDFSKFEIDHPQPSFWTDNIAEIFNGESETHSLLNSFCQEKKIVDSPLNPINTLPLYLNNLVNNKECSNKMEVIEKLIEIYPYLKKFDNNYYSFIFNLFKQSKLNEKKLALKLLTVFLDKTSLAFPDFPAYELLKYISNDDFYKDDKKLEALFLASNPSLLRQFDPKKNRTEYIHKLKDCILINLDEEVVENIIYRLKILINIFDYVKPDYTLHTMINLILKTLFNKFESNPSLLMNGEISYVASLVFEKYHPYLDFEPFLILNDGIVCPYLKISDRLELLQSSYIFTSDHVKNPVKSEVEMALVKSLFCKSILGIFPLENKIFEYQLIAQISDSYTTLKEERIIQTKTVKFLEEKALYEADLLRFKLNICNQNIDTNNNIKISTVLLNFITKIDLVYTQTIIKLPDLFNQSINGITSKTKNKYIKKKFNEFKKNLLSLKNDFVLEINKNEIEFKDKLEKIKKEEELINNIDSVKNSLLDKINSNLLPTKFKLETEIDSLKKQMEILFKHHTTICDLENENSSKIENEVTKIKQMVEQNEEVNYKNDFENSLEILNQFSTEKINIINSSLTKIVPEAKKDGETESYKELKERFHLINKELRKEQNNNRILSERIRVLEQKLQKTSLQNEIQAEDFSREPIKKVKEKLLSLIRSFSNEEIALIEQESSLLDLNKFEELLENQNGSYMKKDALIEMACSCGILLKVIPGKGNHNNYSHVLKDNSMLNGSGFSISSHGDDVDPNCVKSAIKAMFKVISHYAKTVKKLS
jgi:hypothetical protein